MGLILTEGSKKRLLHKLDKLIVMVEHDQDRETIMSHAAEIMPAVISELNYFEPSPKELRKRKNESSNKMKEYTGGPRFCLESESGR